MPKRPGQRADRGVSCFTRGRIRRAAPIRKNTRSGGQRHQTSDGHRDTDWAGEEGVNTGDQMNQKEEP